MKKIRLLNIVNSFILIVFLISLISCYYVYNETFDKIWYLIIVFYCAIRLYIKYYLFRNDNTLWFAIALTVLWGFMIAYNFYGLSYKYWPILAQIPSISSGVVYIIYKNNLHLYLNILINTITTPFMLITMGYLSVGWFVIVEICAVIIAFVIVNIIDLKFKRR